MRPDFIAFLERSGMTPLTALVPQAGVVYSIVLLVTGAVFIGRARRMKILPLRSLEIILAAAVGGAIGTRFFFLVITGELLQRGPSVWFDPSRGTASWGAWLGAIAGIAGYVRFSGLTFWPILDTAIPCAGLAEFIGRWSCVLAGDDFGRVSTVPWAIRFPEQSLPYQAQVDLGTLPPEAAASLPVHPFQFYLMANGLMLFLVVSAVWRRDRGRPGYTSAIYLTAYGCTRFCWEFFRDPAAGGAQDALSVSQWMCLGFVAVGTALLLRGRQRIPQDIPAT